MGTIYTLAGIISIIVTILVIVKICQIAKNTSEIMEALTKMQNNETTKQEIKKQDYFDSSKSETIQQIESKNENQEKSLYEQQQEFWQ